MVRDRDSTWIRSREDDEWGRWTKAVSCPSHVLSWDDISRVHTYCVVSCDDCNLFFFRSYYMNLVVAQNLEEYESGSRTEGSY